VLPHRLGIPALRLERSELTPSQRLGGFGAAWVECPDADGTGGESVDEALARALEARPELLRQLRAHREGVASRTEH
jgi:hypothetical protein